MHERDSLAEQLRDLRARAQVLGVLGPEPAEVDDALDARGLGGLAEVHGRLPVAGREVLARAAAHRVDQVVGGAAALERLGQPGPGHRVALASVHLRRKVGARGFARQRAHAYVAALQFGDQLGADVASRSGDEDGSGIACHRRLDTQREAPLRARVTILTRRGPVSGPTMRGTLNALWNPLATS